MLFYFFLSFFLSFFLFSFFLPSFILIQAKKHPSSLLAIVGGARRCTGGLLQRNPLGKQFPCLAELCQTRAPALGEAALGHCTSWRQLYSLALLKNSVSIVDDRYTDDS